MESAPLLFDLGKSTPTTRQIADLVKAGGADALTDAVRRADEAKYAPSAQRKDVGNVIGMLRQKYGVNRKDEVDADSAGAAPRAAEQQMLFKERR